ncbi:MAG: 50S ribosomal protein L11 methyltransferase [Chloroflexota bacterium]
MDWLEVSLITDGEGAEAVSEVLRPFAYQESVVIEQLGDESSLDPMAMLEAVTVKIYIPEDEDTPELRRRIQEIIYYMGRLYPLPEPQFKRLAEQDWANAWKAHYHPFRIGNHIWIRPSWIAPEEAPEVATDDIVLVLDPGMAFGTGLHPTTQSCLIALEKLAQPGMRVLDAGTGSGILAIASAKLGVADVAAFDTDDLAVKATQANADVNGVAPRLNIWQGQLDSVPDHTAHPQWDLVLVNILAPIIIRLLNENDLLGYVAPTGRIVLSGIIDEQGASIEEALNNAGGHVVEVIQSGDWVTYIASPNPVAPGDSPTP